MEALAAAASVAGLISLAIEIPKIIDSASTIWSAPDEAAQLARTMEALISALRKLEEFLKTDEARDIGMASDSALVIAISSCQTRILDLAKKMRSQLPPQSPSGSASTPQSKLKKAVAMLRWPLDKKECLTVISELHALQSTFEFCLVMDNCQQMSKSHKEVISQLKSQETTLSQIASSFPAQAAQVLAIAENIRTVGTCLQKAAETIDRIQVGITELQDRNKESERRKAEELHGQALKWLSPVDPSARQDELRDTRALGTCGWILEQPAFNTWVHLKASTDATRVTCWVGDPGQGKTHTMSRVVDHLQDLCSKEVGYFVSYLYLDYQGTSGYSITTLLGTLVRQLLSQFELMPDPVAEFVRIECVKNQKSAARPNDIHRTLELLQPQIKRLFICVDALDEFRDSEAFLAACHRFSSIPTSFFFIGRPSIASSVRSAFRGTDIHTIQHQNRDIEAFVSLRLESERHRHVELTPAWLADQIQVTVPQQASGMFLLASLHLTRILSHDTVHRRREALASLSPTIEGAFLQTLERIREHHHIDRAFHILAWVYLVGPIPLTKLRHMLAIEPHHTHFQHDNLPHPTTCLDCCLGLAKLDNIKRQVPGDAALVTFVHSTLRMYFDSNPEIIDGVTPSLLATCFAFLSFPLAQRPEPIQGFAEATWVRLLHACRNPTNEFLEAAWQQCVQINSMIHKHFFRGTLFKHSEEIEEPSAKLAWIPRKLKLLLEDTDALGFRQDGPREHSLFHTACLLGLSCCRAILARLADLAAQLSHAEASRFINDPDSFGASPLGWVLLPESPFYWPQGSSASLSKFDTFEHNLRMAEEVFKAFPRLDPGKPLWGPRAIRAIRSSTVARSENGSTVSYFSSMPTMFILGNSSAAPEAVRNCIAAMQVHLEFNFWSILCAGLIGTDSLWGVVSFWGSDLPPFWEPGYQARQVNGPATAVDPTSPPSDIDDEQQPKSRFAPGSLYHLADKLGVFSEWTSMGYVNTSRKNSTNALLSPEIRRINALFEPGSSVPVLTTSCLVKESEKGYHYLRTRQDTKIFPFPASLTGTRGERARCPKSALLHLAAAIDDVELGTFAVYKFGLDPNQRDSEGRTALQLALTNHSTLAAFFLIGLPNIDLNLTDSADMLPLQFSAKHRQWSLFWSILRRRSTNIDAQDREGKTALHYVVQARERMMMKALLRRRADINIQDADGNTALHLAIIMRDSRMVEILLEPRPGVGFSAGNLQTALNLAIDAGAKFIMEISRAIQTGPQPLLLEGLTPTSSDLSRRPELKVVQFLAATGTTNAYTEKDLDFMLRLVSKNGGQTGSRRNPSGVAAASLQHSNVPLWLPDPVGTVRSALAQRAENVAIYLIRSFPVDLDRMGDDGESALQLAIVYNAPKLVSLLFSNFPEAIDLARLTPDGFTAPQLAVVHMRLEMLRSFVAATTGRVAEAFQHFHEHTGATVLTLAITRRFAGAVPLLLECPYVDVNRLDRSGRAAIHHAVLQQNIAVVTQLVKCPRVDAALVSSDGRSALAYAALCAGEAMVTLLLGTGLFNILSVDTYGKTALDWARFNTSPGVSACLREASSRRVPLAIG
ncbi:hypothetical protein B0T14DRAFT_190945 [Immersiella caudata]|uniref:Nephrocystin 3-like N-terminal domain-containing protein n=1 Tax=Immersiella caudata TaxID=314043 RepID=A0AA39WYD2_9PEZI|nr:hypothetical protein B0T14DRAFT_190945 [Immersiella caudata]